MPRTRAPQERVQDFKELYLPFSEEKVRTQAARCMDCGVPFCHHGCPLGNHIPEFNDAVYAGHWEEAYAILAETNDFPEFTGRICPAPCEGSCVLGINKPPVAIELIEKNIAERAFELGLVQVPRPQTRTGLRVAVIGSGPAGLAAAIHLNAYGHEVCVYERDEAPGGLLRYGIPDFKLEKWIVERRIRLMEEAGIVFRCGVEVGKDISGEALRSEYQAVILCAGATVPRDVPIPGRSLQGIHYAMDYLTEQNRRVSGQWQGAAAILATDKHVIVIGGGDTGSDCIGTANRQGARSVTQITWGNRPPSTRPENNPWPQTPMVLYSTTSHEEGCARAWNILTKSFVDDGQGHVCGLEVVEIEWEEGRKAYHEIPGTQRVLPCDLALIAVGFSHPEQKGLAEQLGIGFDKRGNVATNKYHSTVPGVFAAGDMRRGQSLVVWAIAEGRQAAQEAHQWLGTQGQ
ncbi:MAG: glutamate synthase subunit beta [Bacteroidia bacterium]